MSCPPRKALTQLKRQRGIIRGVQLHPGKSAFFNRRHDIVEIRIDEDAVLSNTVRQMRRDSAYLHWRNPSRALRKNETHCIRARLDRQLSIFEIRIGADFHPHGYTRSTAGE